MQFVFEKENWGALKIAVCKPLMFLAITFEKGLLRVYCPSVIFLVCIFAIQTFQLSCSLKPLWWFCKPQWNLLIFWLYEQGDIVAASMNVLDNARCLDGVRVFGMASVGCEAAHSWATFSLVTWVTWET